MKTWFAYEMRELGDKKLCKIWNPSQGHPELDARDVVVGKMSVVEKEDCWRSMSGQSLGIHILL